MISLELRSEFEDADMQLAALSPKMMAVHEKGFADQLDQLHYQLETCMW